MTYTLVIGSRNLASWSLRPWLAMRQFELGFDDVVIQLDQPDTRSRILQHSPAGKVPVLMIDGAPVWDSLAILETLADRHPELGFWPRAAAARARARAVSAEMHAGFAAMRRELPMDCMLRRAAPALSADAAADVARVQEIWRDCRAGFAAGGRFLFGAFCNADAMYAPVVSRFVTYDVAMDDVCRAYVEAVMALPSMQDWLAGAADEVAARA